MLRPLAPGLVGVAFTTQTWPSTIPHVVGPQLSRISCCEGTRHPATAVFTLQQMDLTETVCKHHKTNFCKLPRFSHLSPSVREVKVRLKNTGNYCVFQAAAAERLGCDMGCLTEGSHLRWDPLWHVPGRALQPG